MDTLLKDLIPIIFAPVYIPEVFAFVLMAVSKCIHGMFGPAGKPLEGP